VTLAAQVHLVQDAQPPGIQVHEATLQRTPSRMNRRTGFASATVIGMTPRHRASRPGPDHLGRQLRGHRRGAARRPGAGAHRALRVPGVRPVSAFGCLADGQAAVRARLRAWMLGVVKFGLLFTAMAHGMPAGLASLVLQLRHVLVGGSRPSSSASARRGPRPPGPPSPPRAWACWRPAAWTCRDNRAIMTVGAGRRLGPRERDHPGQR